MCEPLTLAIAGAVAGGGLQSVMGVMDLTNRFSQQDALNSAIEDSYNQQVSAARSRALLDQQNLAQQTQTEQQKNQQEARQANQEAMQSAAAAEAAGSALNIAGNTAQRASAVTDINTLNREGAYAARGEGITAQHMMNALSVTDTYDNTTKSALLNAQASWRPLTSGWIMESLGLASGIVGGAASGASAGGAAAGLFGSSGGGAAPSKFSNNTLPNGVPVGPFIK